MSFDDAFRKLTGDDPFPWQTELFHLMSQGPEAIPKRCDIPTGLGKTSVIAIWLLARRVNRSLPRRLVYVVNRRTVVDQTTNEVQKYKQHYPTLAISTLRGQYADNREWSADPSREAVICGTVDMIGSRLLFSGYGVGTKSRPLHAGFLGQDVLLVHDEAHLEPAFQRLIEEIAREQKRCEEFGHFHVMELTATSRGEGEPFKLSDEDKQNERVKKRIHAKKKLHLEPLKDPKKLAEQIVEKALVFKDSGLAVLIFVRTVEDVLKVRDALAKAKRSVQTLTGTMRGKERDDLIEDKTFARFLPKPPEDATAGTVYLVCTSAGEVGVNISADHLVCDLSTFEGMAQRFGRVNRFGNRTETEIHVIHPIEFDEEVYAQRRLKTLDFLRELNGDASPAALGKLDAEKCLAAFAPTPTILPTSDILFDAWALTSIDVQLPGRPEVGPYLHGLADDLPQTTIAWRFELDILKDEEQPEIKLKAIFSKHGIRPHESLTVPSHRVTPFLKEMRKTNDGLGKARVALLLNRGVKCVTVDELIKDDGILRAEPTLVLPALFGGLDDKGMLASPKKESKPAERFDIADEPGYEPDPKAPPRQRVLIERTSDGWQTKPLHAQFPLPEDWELEADSSTQLVRQLQQVSGLKIRLVCTLKSDNEGDTLAIVCLSPAPKKDAAKEQSLTEHVTAVEKEADRLTRELLKDHPQLADALRFAAKWHDEGKKAKRWQRYIGRRPDGEELGKSAEWRDPKILGGYRHEFGSLLRIPDEEQKKLGEALDLALHLIAAHHGSARPHFAEPWDDEFGISICDSTHEKAVQRFARLQRRYGRWGLAYLESLLRAADIAASKAIGIDPEVDTDDIEGGVE